MSVVLKPKGASDKGTEANGAGKKGDMTEMAFFVALNVLVLPFSAYQTFKGYEADVAGNVLAAVALAVISALLFAAMNFGIRNARLQGKPIFWKTMMYIIPLGISLPANFNAFYSNMTRDQLFDQGVADYEMTLRDTKDNALVALENCMGTKTFEDAYKGYYDDMKNQYEGNAQEGSGWGSACVSRWNTLKTFLKDEDPGNVGIGENTVGSGNSAFNKATNLAEGVKNNIISSKQEKMQPYADLITDLSEPVLKHVKTVKDDGKLKEEGKILLDELVTANNQIGNKINAALVDCGGFTYTVLKPSEKNRESTIEYSLQNAFIDKPSPSATYFALFLSAIIDFSAILYILFFVKNGKEKVTGRINSGPRSIN